MLFTLILVASNKRLSAAHLAGVKRYIDSQGLNEVGDPIWLEDHKAAEFTLSACASYEQMMYMREALRPDNIDIFCLPSENRRKKLLLADMDSTIVPTETLDELADHAGIKQKIAAITERSMNGEMDFQDALRERVALLKDLPTDTLQKTLDQTKLNPGAKIFVMTMRNHGAHCVLVSGGFTFFTSAIAEKAGFHRDHGNTLTINSESNNLTGQVGEPILDNTAKLNFLRQYTQELELNSTDSLAIGDGANDLPMIEDSGLGIGFRPKPLLQKHLINQINFGDLTTALYVQGYTQKDFFVE